jgi:predicted small lipoprotein YifL
MKKRILVLFALLSLLVLAACGKAAPAPTPTPAPVVTETPAPTPEPTPEPTPAPTPTPLPLIPDLPEIHDEALEQIFEAVLSVYPGSAGCSLRAARCAACLLDWGTVTSLTDDEIYSAVGSWLDEQDSERLNIFLESILSVYDRCYDLKGEHAQEIMSDAGIETSLYPWNERAFRAVEMVSLGCGLR